MEPDFHNNMASLSDDMHLDWLKILASENIKRIDEAVHTDRIFNTTNVIEYIFTICVRLRLPQEVKYSAALIFDKFMLEHTQQLYEFIYESERSVSEKHREWNRVEATLSRQLTLRILSAIQIASKLHSYHDSLSRKTVKLCLQTLGFAYTEESVMRSEIRVLTTINWQISYHCTPLIYVESLLKLLEVHWTTKFDVQAYWQYALLIMDCVFLYWDEIYKRMLINVLGEVGQNVQRERLCRVQADWLLLGNGIIATAANCVDGMEAAEKVIVELQAISGTPLADITDVCVAITESITEKQKSLNIHDSDNDEIHTAWLNS
ncbi:unnamed protein product [Dracunculus medinensis]|uniref:Cyclin N-terminal domain-containing protein n=1 Tax=Dracunculus medinensis TaxID=318479 RepID=A0A0N4UBE1_DRAME|nr:unnamed protein product [Dracunculus medinensis]